jgi:protein-S-isoprenylcysteine O-methyltransferase Ste14
LKLALSSTAVKITIQILKSIIGVFLLLALLFGPAGTLKWVEAWLYIIFYLIAVAGIVLWMKKKSPGLLKERMSTKKDAKSWDKKIIRVYTLLLMIMLAVAGLDAVRFRWSRVPLSLKIAGFSGFIPAFLLAFSAMTQNPYLSDLVRIQKDRGHRVCTTGPYKYVRHPMYVGVILLILCLPLALGSFYALIPGSLIILLFILRTFLEDKTLQAELPGYKEYADRVRYKLIPGIW